ncbi:MAG: excinuclease ABC subunit C [Bacteroidetes bacterium HGW-Bacteroidetes-4]|jgi:putative endonuclease|nr:MAG: excinuclease ABC subunit C [Bacteroidetes bacterium HGW-Bacteroidetes-4]
MFYTYILYAEKSGSFYIGQTNNLSDRLERHNDGKNKYTRNKGPWNIAAFFKCETRSQAVLLEKKLKNFKNGEFALNWLLKNGGSNGRPDS